jgi:hypothetical protein
MREIDWDAPLSDDDKAWLLDRDQHAKVAANEQQFASSDDEDETDGTTEEPDDDYDDWKVAELRKEAGDRDPAIEGAATMKKDELITALRVWDGEHGE